MKLYLEPTIDHSRDGTYFTMMQRVTPQLIDDRIKRLNGFKKARFDIDKIVSIVRNSSSKQDAEDSLRKAFKLTAPQAYFILNATIEEMEIYCNKKKWEEEVSRWLVLKELLIDDPFSYKNLEWDE